MEGEPSTTPEWRLEQKPEGRKGGRLEGEREGVSEGVDRSDFLNAEAHQRRAQRLTQNNHHRSQTEESTNTGKKSPEHT